MHAKKEDTTSSGIKIITENRQAYFNYHVIEKFEAGIVLSGPEIKSIRAHGMSIAEAYIRPEENELLLLGAHVKPYEFTVDPTYNPTRARKLLLNKSEIIKLRARVERKGLTLVPLKLYLKRGFAKLEIALAQGKAAPDKRDDIKKREANREASRAMRERHK